MISMPEAGNAQMKCKDFYSIQCTVDNIACQQEAIIEWLSASDKQRIVTFINPHVYNHAMGDPILWELLNRSDINSIDGVGIKLGFLLKNFRSYPRTIMTYLFEQVLFCKLTPRINAILIGTSQEEVSRAANYINVSSTSLYIEAHYHGFHDLDYYISEIANSPTVKAVLIGMSTPKSEHLMHKLTQSAKNIIVWHIGGGTIKCFADTKRRSPVWLSKIGFEWIHRVFFEPHLINRYILGIPLFIYHILRSGTRTRVERSH